MNRLSQLFSLWVNIEDLLDTDMTTQKKQRVNRIHAKLEKRLGIAEVREKTRAKQKK